MLKRTSYFMQKKAIIKELKYFKPELIIKAWPSNLPLIYFGGNNSLAILPICFYEVAFNELAKVKFHQQNESQELPFVSGYVGILSYDEFCPNLSPINERRPSRVFRVNKTLIFDQINKRLFICQRGPLSSEPKPKNLVDLSDFVRLFAGNNSQSCDSKQDYNRKPFRLNPYETAESYLAKCKSSISEIENGRFYQINLLRYFMLEGQTDKASLIARFFEQSGPFGAIFLLDDLRLISFSPERFVKVVPEKAGPLAMAYPIKGTIGRHPDLRKDLEARNWLKNSEKDHQELHMIVDLMRNDLNRVSTAGSVCVAESAKIKKFKQVYHLQAKIESQLRDDLNLLEFFTYLAPGGSITGAPKIEVMKAISELEGRNRGYFMGSCFYWDDGGFLDSSILIRTLVSKIESVERYEYAAGSGIVLQSLPDRELEEISAKCRVISDQIV